MIGQLSVCGWLEEAMHLPFVAAMVEKQRLGEVEQQECAPIEHGQANQGESENKITTFFKI